MSIIHSSIMGQDSTGISIDTSADNKGWIVVLIAGVVAIVAVVITGGTALLGAIWGFVKTTFSVLATTGAISLLVKAGTIYAISGIMADKVFDNNLYLPLYSISPEEIFKGQILMFDIDFFNPKDNIKISTEKIDKDGNTTGDEGNTYVLKEWSDKEDKLYEELEKNNEKIKNYYYEDNSSGKTKKIITSKQNISLDLQKTVSQWYNAIRNIAIVLSLSVLLYIGIRMLLSTVAQDKAKYKQMITDWLVGICLLFFMHYIMSFSVSLAKTFTEMMASTDEKANIVIIEKDKKR